MSERRPTSLSETLSPTGRKRRERHGRRSHAAIDQEAQSRAETKGNDDARVTHQYGRGSTARRPCICGADDVCTAGVGGGFVPSRPERPGHADAAGEVIADVIN